MGISIAIPIGASLAEVATATAVATGAAIAANAIGKVA